MNTTPRHYIIRIGSDRNNFNLSLVHNTWGFEEFNKNGHNSGYLTMCEKMKENDILWFLKSKSSKPKNNEKNMLIACARFIKCYIDRENKIWDDGHYAIRIKYTNIYNNINIELKQGIIGNKSILNYSDNVKNIINLDDAHNMIKKFSRIIIKVKKVNKKLKDENNKLRKEKDILKEENDRLKEENDRLNSRIRIYELEEFLRIPKPDKHNELFD